jgi:hypothetical protein
MKSKLPGRKAASPGTNAAHAAHQAGRDQRGIALVITLILLSVVTFMAVTFLVLSRSERGAVNTTTENAHAREAADEAAERAKMAVISSIMVNNNLNAFDVAVSTNFINPNGFYANLSAWNQFTNVSYNYPNGAPLTGNDFLRNLTNLWFMPRPPVYITNRLAANSMNFPYYLDWNRNGRYDTNGYLPVIAPAGGYYDLNGNWIANPIPGNTLYNFFVGDPEWVGGLERPDFPHSSSNKFIYRYAYVVVPASKTLDINAIHNYARLGGRQGGNMAGTGDRFLRDQGVGTWEMNLGAFFVDLNTNQWPYPVADPVNNYAPYAYNYQDTSIANTGAAFDDSVAILRYRYNNSWANLGNVSSFFGAARARAFGFDYVDGWSHGNPLMTTTWWSPAGGDPDKNLDSRGTGWPGSDNPNHFYTMQELFDTNKTSIPFVNRLISAGTNTDSYQRYTFYRLLSQLGTDTTPGIPEAGKINLNYDNITYADQLTGARSVTNLQAWDPVTFFTNAAIRLLANAGFTTGQGPTNILFSQGGNTSLQIQVYPTNFYTASVHQMLQLAANIYDATTTTNPNLNMPRSVSPATNGFPSVYRPVFTRDNQNRVFITGYQEVSDTQILRRTVRDLSDPTDLAAFNPTRDLVYGVPLVVGAKKGFPNFNEFSMQTMVYVTRLLEFRRNPALPADDKNNRVIETNQMYIMGISNVFGVEAWNSYSNTYPRRLQILVAADNVASLTNEIPGPSGVLLSNLVHAPLGKPVTTFASVVMDPASTPWNGWIDKDFTANSFVIPLHPITNNFFFLTNSTYRQFSGPPHFVMQTHRFERQQTGFPVPQLWLNLNTRLRFVIVDLDANRIVDYVNLSSTHEALDIMAKLREGAANCASATAQTAQDPASQWCTNRLNNGANAPTYGIINQILAGLYTASSTSWKDFSRDPYAGRDVESAIDGFRYNMLTLSPLYSKDYGKTFYKSNIFYAPLSPYRPLVVHTVWQANDPLVHYTIGDLALTNLNTFEAVNSADLGAGIQPSQLQFNLGAINSRYEPWGGNPSGKSHPGQSEPPKWDPAIKDPLVARSDDWDFTTNKFPNIGWLGRVHRGTPWQTINLKSTNATDLAMWKMWTGNDKLMLNYGQILPSLVPLHTNNTFNVYANDAFFTHPVNDRSILDLFTATFNENAARSQLSINQTNLAAWSAALGGVLVLSNSDRFDYSAIQPAGTFTPGAPTPLAYIVNGINRTRTNTFLNPDRTFHHLGDLLNTPELTMASPYLSKDPTAALNDEVYERIPQQVLGLLRAGEAPRFVIYAWGQALKPADRSIITSGPFFKVCTNYQITAEVATRTVVRVVGTAGQPHAVVESFNVLPSD